MTLVDLFAYLFLKVKYELLNLADGDINTCPLLRRDNDVIADVILYFDLTEILIEYSAGMYQYSVY